MKVTSKEIKTAIRMAERKAGVTRRQLADRLGVTMSRARLILNHADFERPLVGVPLGAGKQNRSLVFRPATFAPAAARKTRQAPKPTRKGRRRGRVAKARKAEATARKVKEATARRIKRAAQSRKRHSRTRRRVEKVRQP